MTSQTGTRASSGTTARASGHLGRLRASADTPITVGHLDDQALAWNVKRARRAVEDAHDGSAPGIDARAAQTRLETAENEQRIRAALRQCWLALDGGCDSYTDFITAGGLPAVLAGGLPPGYGLAATLDRAMFLRGCLHVLDWPDPDRHGSVRGRRPLLEPDQANATDDDGSAATDGPV